MSKKGSPISKIPLTKIGIQQLLVEKTDYLTKRGYAIFKDQYDTRFLENIRKELTVIPFTTEDFGNQVRSFPVYLESPKKLYIPKHFAFKHIGAPASIHIKEPAKTNIVFSGSVRENQLIPITKFLDSCNLDGYYTEESLLKYSYGGIISLPCGWGKTVIGLYLAARLGVKTLIIVHKEFLVNQWKERIEQFIPDAKIGTIQQNKMDVVGKDIVIGMLQSISMKDYPDWIFDDFGFTIVDECHHISSEIFSRALPKINSRYTLALSATPKRKDRLECVTEWYLGPYLYVVQQQNTKRVRVNMIYYYNNNALYSGVESLPNGKPCIARMTNNITEFSRRNELILEILRRSVQPPESHLLALSDRREHLRYLHDTLEERKTSTKGYYVGGMKEKDLKLTESKKIMLSTYTMSSEALDVASLNTLILMTSHSGGSVHTQSCGRILRKAHGDFVPTVWDIVDDFGVYKNQARKRLDYYKKQNYEIYKVIIHDSDEIPIEVMISRLDNLEEVDSKKRRLELKQEEFDQKKCLLDEDDY
jgi:superfamily II DNA or RNA helicase